MGNYYLTRRDMIRKTTLAGVSVALGGLVASVGCGGRGRDENFIIKENDNVKALKIDRPDAPKPNVIIILTDDLGYGDLGCYGSRSIRTPNLDRLAREGARFTDFYTCNSLCTPSRAGLLTGRYPQRTGLDWILRPEPSFKSTLVTRFGQIMARLGISDVGKAPALDGMPVDEILLPEALKIAGYRTGMVGKWHLGNFVRYPEFFPTRHGFDYFYGLPYPNRMTPLPLYQNEKCVLENVEEQSRLTALYTKAAIEFMEGARGKPFFLYFAQTWPHEPLHVSKRFKGKSRGGLYGDVVEELDWGVGELMSYLRRKDLDRNTLVLFTSDNGPIHSGSTAGMRGAKGQSFEGGFRVPLITRWPGKIPAGTVCHEPAMNIDFFPTLLGLAGIGLPRDRVIDGKNIFGLMSGTQKKSPHEALFFYHHDELEGIRSGKWKYFRYVHTYQYPMPIDKPHTPLGRLAKGSSGHWPLLYDMDLDPNESYDVMETYPEIGKKMLAMMETWEREMLKNPRGWL